MRQTLRTRQLRRVIPSPASAGRDLHRGQRWKRTGPVGVVMLVAFVALAFIGVLVWASLGPHRAVGSWRHQAFSLRVDPDEVATVHGLVCSWVEIDRNTIRIQPPTKIPVPSVGTIELAFHLTVEEDGRSASLDAFGFPVTLERDGPAR